MVPNVAQREGARPQTGFEEDILAGLDGGNVIAIIVNYRTPDLTEQCLAALSEERSLVPGLKAVVIDGASDDGSADQIANFLEGARYRGWAFFMPLSLNGGFGWANNQAILRLANTSREPPYIYFLNPDARVLPGAVAALVQELEKYPCCGAAGSQLLDQSGHPTASAFAFPSARREFASAAESERMAKLLGLPKFVIRSQRSVQVDWVTGASVMFRSEALREVGLFDDGFFLYFEEVELMHRLSRSGWQVRHVPSSKVVHLEGASTGVAAGSNSNQRPLYWYKSRSRYFFLTGGRWALLKANIAASIGALLGARRRFVGKGEVPRKPKRVFKGVEWPVASVPRWGDEPGRPPAWMAERG